MKSQGVVVTVIGVLSVATLVVLATRRGAASDNAPSKPLISEPPIPNEYVTNKPCTFVFSSIDPAGLNIKYELVNGISYSSAFLPSGEITSMSNIWYTAGTHKLKVRATNTLGLSSDWAEVAVTITEATPGPPPRQHPYYRVGDIFVAWGYTFRIIARDIQTWKYGCESIPAGQVVTQWYDIDMVDNTAEVG